MNPAAVPGGTVLVIEDDPGIRRLERSTLERAGYRAELAGTIAEARERLAGGEIELLLVDYQLANNENGLEFYRELQREGRDLPAILVTGFSDEVRIIEAMRAGMRDFIPKTPNFIELVAPTVERVMSRVRQERRLLDVEAAGRAKDNFLAALSHELRTPLTPVLALVSALRVDARLPEDVRQDLAIIHRNVSLEARLIDDLLDLTRIARGKLELRLEGTGAAQKQIACCEELAEGSHLVRGDAARLTQVLWNLLSNAVKFTPEHGGISVRSRIETQDGAAWVAVEVTDTGMGIEPATLPRIFGAFEQGAREITRAFGGLGLGLAISRRIVEMHGGTITAASEGTGKGATFTVRLPLAPEEAAAAKPSASPSGTAPHEGAAAVGPELASAHLLLVEDHTDTAQVMTRMLRRAGYHVTAAATVHEALSRVAETQSEVDGSGRPRPVQLVVSDLGLPDGSGTDLMRELRAKYRLPGIALSGFGMEEDVRAATEAGFAKHLTKPVDFDALLSAIREMLAQS